MDNVRARARLIRCKHKGFESRDGTVVPLSQQVEPMNEIINAVGALQMSTVEIADLCEKRHDHVLRDARAMLDGLKIDQPTFGAIFFDAYKREQPCLSLPKDLTLTLVSGYNVVLRKRIIDRWLALEAATAIAIPTTMAGALRLALAQAEQIEAQALQLEAAKPAVAFVDKYVDATGLKGFRQVCKLLRAKENQFRDFLKAKSIMYQLGGEWVPNAQHLDAGRFVVKAGVSDSDHAFNSARFTAKGVSWVAGEWAKYQVEAHGGLAA